MAHPAKALAHPYPFPLRIHPESDESLFGFALRLSDRNALDRGSELLRFLGARTMRPPFSSAAIERLSTLSMRRAEELGRMQPEPLTKDSFLFLGHPVARTSIFWDRLRFCPSCLEERQIYRQVWDYAPMTVCAAHHVRLIERCPVCEAPLQKGRGIQRWMKCPRGHDIASAVMPQSARSLCSVYVEWRFGSAASLPSILRGMPSEFREARPDAVISLARFLGGVARAAQGVSEVRDASWADDVVLEAGFAVMANWPDRLYQHLETLHAVSPRQLFPASFRNWLRHSSRHLADIESSDPLRLELDRFCVSKGFLFDLADIGTRRAPDGERIPARLACRATGLGTVRFMEMIRESGWSGWQGACSGQSCCLLRRDLDAWSAHDGRRLGVPQVGRELGCRASDVTAMANGGCFGQEAAKRWSNLTAEGAFLLPAEVAGLQNRLRRIIQSRTSDVRSGIPISFSKACFRGRSEAADLLKAVLDGSVSAVGWREPLLGGLLLSADDVAVLHSNRDRQSPE